MPSTSGCMVGAQKLNPASPESLGRAQMAPSCPGALGEGVTWVGWGQTVVQKCIHVVLLAARGAGGRRAQARRHPLPLPARELAQLLLPAAWGPRHWPESLCGGGGREREQSVTRTAPPPPPPTQQSCSGMEGDDPGIVPGAEQRLTLEGSLGLRKVKVLIRGRCEWSMGKSPGTPPTSDLGNKENRFVTWALSCDMQTRDQSRNERWHPEETQWFMGQQNQYTG